MVGVGVSDADCSFRGIEPPGLEGRRIRTMTQERTEELCRTAAYRNKKILYYGPSTLRHRMLLLDLPPGTLGFWSPPAYPPEVGTAYRKAPLRRTFKNTASPRIIGAPRRPLECRTTLL